MNGFMDASSVDDMDQSCTCACCGTRVSSTSATFDLQSDNGIADLFDHATACKAGFARDQLCCVETEPIKSGDRVEVRSEDPDSDYLESYPATVTVVRREGTFDVMFDKAVAKEAPKPPPCTGGVECPLRSQYNGLHAVRDRQYSRRTQRGWKLYCLLGSRNWHTVDDPYDSSKEVDAWASSTAFRACKSCAASLRGARPVVPLIALSNLHLQLVPPARVDIVMDWESLSRYFDGSWAGLNDHERDDYVGLLAWPSLTEQQMLAAIRMNSYIVRLISSSKQDTNRHATGKKDGDKKEWERTCFKPRPGKEESSGAGNQRGLRR